MKGIIPQGKPWTQNRFGGSIPLKTAKLFKGQGYVSLRSRLNGETVQLWSLRSKLLKQPLVVHSHRKWNHHDGSAPLARFRISLIRQKTPPYPQNLLYMRIFGATLHLQKVAYMFNNPTAAKLHEMKLKVMAQMVSEPDASQRDLSFDERLGIMVERQWLQKKNARIGRNLRSASFSMPTQLEDLDYTADRTIDKPLIRTLSSCLYIEQKLNIVVSGKTGRGKSFLISALGDAACRKGFSVRYFRIPELLLEFEKAKATNRYSKFMKSMEKVKLLILNDLGIKTYLLEESRDILELTESRYNKSSTILSGQVSHTKWYDMFPDPTIADAIMDRVIHYAPCSLM